MTRPRRATIAAGTSRRKTWPSTNDRFTTIDAHALDRLRQACRQPLPHPDADAMLQSGNQALRWLLDQFARLGELPVGLTASPRDLETWLHGSAPELGEGLAPVLEAFQQYVAPNAFRVDHPRFLAFIPGAPSFLSVLGELLCAGTNFFSGVWLEASGPGHVERVVVNWFAEWLGYPADAGGLLTGGGSEATLTALVVARDRLAAVDRSRAVLYVSDQRHWSVDRAAKVIGQDPGQLHAVPVDELFRMVPEALTEACQADRASGLLPWAVVASAGTTNTGSVDPFEDIAAICQAESLWLHGDAAYGWSAVLTHEGKTLLKGIERCDSVTLDPHKWFAQTFDAGCLLVRQGNLLQNTFAIRPDYMRDVEPEGEEINFADLGIALTRRFRALKIWLSVKALGLAWHRDLIDHDLKLAEFAEALLRSTPGFEVLCPRTLSIVCFRYVPGKLRGKRGVDEKTVDSLNLQMIDALRRTGRAFVSSTLLRDRIALRLCFVNWRTKAEDVEEVVRILAELGEELA